MPYADLHVHTTRSDGDLELEAVPTAARRAGVDVVALTDHDRLQPFDEPAVERDGVTILQGIELRVETAEGHRLDLLGYGLEPTDELVATITRLQTDRIERGRAIVDCVEDRFGVTLDVAVDEGFGRPHVARAIDAHPELEYDYQGAFDHVIGSDCPCYVARTIPSFERGRAALAESARLISLAHPLRYPDPDAALAYAAELDAVELRYPYGRDVDRRPVERAIERHDLLATGGTDAHDDRLGVAGLTRSEYDRLNLSV
ncbi:PHP domain-containing protein [Natrarchaeobius oligotrophus]|uniref:PHP domain-containing protein n=1 Tax=Natrarchaeobius chitinivorans TaxID=1679083 RepID=A0A3N6N048_NATCH|nr:PHP domain-containing protein [Natrarchaeobius chitinivorans]RQH00807.1 PHP domain-containing protein [Natrarchaeobius chitinivorans]